MLLEFFRQSQQVSASDTNKKDRVITNSVRLEYLFVILMFLVSVFYRYRFSYPYQTCVQEYENHKRTGVDLSLSAHPHYRAVP